MNNRVNAQEFTSPPKYTIIDSIKGDLDNDDIEELIVAYNSDSINENGATLRVLIIYKLELDKWIKWKESANVIMASYTTEFDPYFELSLKNDTLTIDQRVRHWDLCFLHEDYVFLENDIRLCNYHISWLQGISGASYSIDFAPMLGQVNIKKDRVSRYCNGTVDVQKNAQTETVFINPIKITMESKGIHKIELTTPEHGFQINLKI